MISESIAESRNGCTAIPGLCLYFGLTDKIFQEFPLYDMSAEQAVKQQEPRLHHKNDKAEFFAEIFVSPARKHSRSSGAIGRKMETARNQRKPFLSVH